MTPRPSSIIACQKEMIASFADEFSGWTDNAAGGQDGSRRKIRCPDFVQRSTKPTVSDESSTVPNKRRSELSSCATRSCSQSK